MKIEVTLVVQQPQISRVIKNPLEFQLEEGATIVDVIKLADEAILRRIGEFPVKDYRSLLHMVYHPIENRFYKQVAIQGYTEPGSFLNVREDPKKPLPKSVTIVLVPEGPCISEWEDPIDL